MARTTDTCTWVDTGDTISWAVTVVMVTSGSPGQQDNTDVGTDFESVNIRICQIDSHSCCCHGYTLVIKLSSDSILSVSLSLVSKQCLSALFNSIHFLPNFNYSHVFNSCTWKKKFPTFIKEIKEFFTTENLVFSSLIVL